jgi:type II secretory pathway component GspD/PulD (secretin)
MSTREAQTTVRLKDGETLVIGGLIRDESSKKQAGLPGFSQIAVLRSFFGSSKESSRRTELVILVTPRVVKDPVQIDVGPQETKAGNGADPAGDQLSSTRP